MKALYTHSARLVLLLRHTRNFHSTAPAFSNLFRKKAALDSPSTTSPPADATVLTIRQQLRSSSAETELTQMLAQLQAEATPGKHSFALMNEVIKKLDRSASPSKEMAIPGLSLSQCFDLFAHVVQSVTVDNYRAARFVPRLYLQITKSALSQGNTPLLLSTLELFIHYLHTLGYNDQLYRVLQQFHAEFPDEVTSQSVSTITAFIESSQTPLSPDLLYRLLEISPHSPHLYPLCLEKTLSFILSSQHDSCSIDDVNQAAIASLIGLATHYEYNTDVIKICDAMGDLFPEQELHFLQQVLAKNSYPPQDSTLLAKRALMHPSITMDPTQWKQSLVLKSEYPAVMSLVWDLHANGLTPVIETELTKKGGCITDELYELLALALINSTHDDQYSRLIDLLRDIGFETSIDTYKNLMYRYIRSRNTTQLKKVFQDSMNDGVDWSGEKVLNKFFTVLAEEEGTTNPKEVFAYSRRVKVHLNYLDFEAYNALVDLTLKNRFIDDAIESFKQELPPLNGDSVHNSQNYGQLHDTLFNWFTKSAEDGEDIWSLYQGFNKHFEMPVEWYFPIFKRLTFYERPDLAFQLFQDMKRIHRTTGSIPPPPPEAYIILFKEFGRQMYTEGVETLDAIYKVDLTINSSLPLLNSIMDAYCSLTNLTKVSQVYDQIMASPSGPNNETASIMLKAHTMLSLNNVKKYWNDMDDLGLLPDEDNYERYVIAHCYHNQPQKALEIAQEMEDMDVAVTPKLLKTLYQWTKDEEVKLLVEEWAQKEHQGLWNLIEGQVKGVTVPVLEVPKSLEELGPTQEELRLMRS